MKTVIVFVIACLSYTAYGFVDRRPSRPSGNPIPTFPGLPPINPTFPKNGGQWPDAYKRFRRSFDEGQDFIPLETSQFEIEPEINNRIPRSIESIDELIAPEELESQLDHMRFARQLNPDCSIHPQPKFTTILNHRYRRSALGLDEEFEAQEDQMRVARQIFNPHSHIRPQRKPRPINRHRL